MSADRAVIDVTFADWRLVVVSRGEAAGFDAELTNPGASKPYARKWQASAEEAVDRCCDYMRMFLGAPATARKLRELAREQLR